MKSLILAEKPSVAKEIARVLGCTQKHKHYIEGPAYVVTWALGHLVTLAEPEEYDPKYKTWSLEDLPLLPQRMKLKVIRETTPQFKAIAQLAGRSDLNELIIATDAGREGELVARWIMEMIRWRKPFKRLWISSQTDKAIRDGFASLKPGSAYDPLYRSAVCRAEADWLIGLNITRALTCKHNAQLAAGRVQTPTLAALMERERQIKAFQAKDYWMLRAQLGPFQAVWRSKSQPDGRLFDKDAADALLGRLTTVRTAKISQLKVTEKIEPHPLAYDLTELQRDANKRYGFTAKQTSNVLQKLYEQHKLVTYPRTDSRYLSSDMVSTLPDRLKALQLPPYAAWVKPLLNKPLPVTKRIVDDSKVSDHHAIIPTDERPQLQNLTADERKLYDIIVRRFISLFYPVFRYDETAVTIDISGENFHAKGRITRDAGWKTLYDAGAIASDDENEDAAEDEASSRQTLPPLQSGMELKDVRLNLQKQTTKPPGRYTEAGLLTVMEKHNLGTPATRADIIEKLLQTDTIERRMNTLQPTGKGLQLIELVVPELRSHDLTAEWEQELERISKGKGDADAFMESIRKQTQVIVKQVKESDAEYKPHNLTNSRCPDCSNPLQEIKGKRGKMLVCSSRECSYKRAAEAPLSNKRCPQCRKKMEIHMGKAGKYAQCKPCNVIEMLSESGGGGGRAAKRQQSQLAKQFSDNADLTSGLGEALKAALQKKQE
ncbi:MULTISPECIES: DNA topoisomerase III [unclassified Paenibacillus]|uniref:DNA topoisomerase III n=1 Tax=unclassified Paenibacillus TaxID=185978 RepID=UPI001AE54EEC|nr:MULTISPECIES: DNA topoisomerase III [unclassified Paenibacillus]MBP1155523.1 DNA topoisomerase-3 [Paenibacillus sp. PvP091]MBP1169091.1 DNA topoisomerase-3 [Paenibacillus sp. PvR098]MBP2440119.1 DNA topoisomerase-3 [Paenibacillus sp. PvP052]